MADNQPMARTYTDAERAHALSLVELYGSVNRASKETGIPHPTIRYWRKDVGSPLPAATSLVERRPELVERVRTEIEYIGFGNLSDVMHWDADAKQVRLVPSDELTPAQAAIIESVRIKRERRVRDGGEAWETSDITVKLRDKLAALRLLAQHTGLIADGSGSQTTVNVDARQQTVEAYRALSTEELRALAAGQSDAPA